MSEIYNSPPKYVITIEVFSHKLIEVLTDLSKSGNITYVRKEDDE